MSDFEIVDRNLRAALAFFGHATGDGEVVPGDVPTIFCGLDYGVFNIGMLGGPERSIERVVQHCAAYYASRGKRWSFWLCEEWLDTATRRTARDVFAAAGLRPISHPPGMVAAELDPPRHALPEIEVRPVADAATRMAFAEITGVCFDIPYAICQAVYAPEGAWKGDYRGFVAFSDGVPVANAAICQTSQALGLYSVGTMPEYRRKGYSEALLRHLVTHHREGRQPIVLQSSTAGYRLYRSLGFRDVSRYVVYLTK